MIPVIPIEDILAGRSDEMVTSAATGSGFMTISGVDGRLGLAEARRTLLSFFHQPEDVRRQTLRHKYDPSRKNVYRGLYLAEPEKDTHVEGFDMGPDVADAARCGDGSDPLTEPTPLPPMAGFAGAAAIYYRAMEHLGGVVTRTLLRGIGANPDRADQIFANSISTLRVLHYPAGAAARMGETRRLETPLGARWIMTGAHTDSGFVTLLWQDGTGGLQARDVSGDWVDVPPAEGGIVVNFGQLLADWTGGRIKATEHRVYGGLAERFSVPFFFEPAVDARIAALFDNQPDWPGDLVYGDYLWKRMGRFGNFVGVERKPAA